MPSERDDLTLNIDNPETAIVLAAKLTDHQINLNETKLLTVKPDKNTIQWKAQDGEWRIITFRKRYVFDTCNKYMPNLLNNKTIATFAQHVLEPLKTHLHEYTDSVFNGFVTAIPFVKPSDNSIPWDDELLTSYKTYFKKDLIKLLPALFFENCTHSQKLRQQFYTFVFDTVNTHFVTPLETWMKKNHLSSWILYNDNSKRNTSNDLDGEMISACGTSNISGLESNLNAHENIAQYRLFADNCTLERKGEIVNFIGRNRHNSASSLQSLKREFDFVNSISPGITVIDGFHMNADYSATMSGSVNSFIYSSEWKFMSSLTGYAARVNDLCKDTKWYKQALVLSPLQEMLSDYFPSNNTYSHKGFELFSKTIATLDRLSITYDCVSDNFFASCELSEEGGIIASSKNRTGLYHAIIIPFAPLISKTVLTFIEKAVQKNVSIFFIDEIPKGTVEDGITPALTSRIMKLLDPKKHHISIIKSDSPDSGLAEIETPFFTISNSRRDSDIIVSSGKSESFDIYMMHNTSDSKDLVIHATLPEHKHLNIVDMETGEIFELDNIEREDGLIHLDINFMPGGTFFILGSSVKIASHPFVKFPKTGVNPFTLSHRCYRIIFKDQWNFSTSSLNSLPLGTWNMRLGLNRESGTFSHYYETTFQVRTQPQCCYLVVNDRLLFKTEHDSNIEILVNGIKADKQQNTSLPAAETADLVDKVDHDIPDISLNRLFTDKKSIFDITSLLVKGGNRISIRTNNRNPEPQSMYLPPQLFGDFVIVKDKTSLILDKTTTIAGYGSWTKYGFPFLSGKGTYSQTFEVPNEYEKIILRFLQVSGTLQVRLNGKNLGIQNWHPFEIDITSHCLPKRNEIDICVVNTADNVIRMNGQASGLIGEVFLDVY